MGKDFFDTVAGRSGGEFFKSPRAEASPQRDGTPNGSRQPLSNEMLRAIDAEICLKTFENGFLLGCVYTDSEVRNANMKRVSCLRFKTPSPRNCVHAGTQQWRFWLSSPSAIAQRTAQFEP